MLVRSRLHAVDLYYRRHALQLRPPLTTARPEAQHLLPRVDRRRLHTAEVPRERRQAACLTNAEQEWDRYEFRRGGGDDEPKAERRRIGLPRVAGLLYEGLMIASLE